MRSDPNLEPSNGTILVMVTLVAVLVVEYAVTTPLLEVAVSAASIMLVVVLVLIASKYTMEAQA